MKSNRFAAACLVIVSASWADDATSEPIKVTIDELFQTMLLNEARFDEQYTDRVLHVTGKVLAISKLYGDDGQARYGVNVTGNDGYSLTFYVSVTHRKHLAKYNPGDEIKLRGMCRGHVLSAGELQFEDVEPIDK